jgi:Xaa-Pro aminopeptidase
VRARELVHRSTGRYTRLVVSPDAVAASPAEPPFDLAHIDGLMERAQLDAILVSSSHNLRYLLGGYRFFLYDTMDAVGMSRYLPLLGYVRGRPEATFYVGSADEGWALSTTPPWVPAALASSWTTTEAAGTAADLLRDRVGRSRRIGVELPFLPADAMPVLARGLDGAEFVDAIELLDELRAVKRQDELEKLRFGATAVVEAMLEVFERLDPAQSKLAVAEALRCAETVRGLSFGYCLIASGDELNRAPSGRRVGAGAAVSLDSGAHFEGYVADLARMGIVGDPSDHQNELLEAVAEVQAAARAVVRAGARGAEVFESARAAVADQQHPERFSFMAHGMGLRSHEAPRLTDTGSPPYPATHRDRPLLAGMVLSLETHVADPIAGFVKLEDLVFVTTDGHEPVADVGRSWNKARGSR